MDRKKFYKLVHREASEWRHKKLQELSEKENSDEMEIYLIKRLAELHGGGF